MDQTDFLKEFLKNPNPKPSRNVYDVEYRLLCSGEIYNGSVIAPTGWRKSSITRLLLRKPFLLFVSSQPFDRFPQEICLRARMKYRTISEENVMSTFLPSDEIVRDISSILSLLTHRLVSNYGKIRERHTVNLKEYGTDYRKYFQDFPQPIFGECNSITWKHRGFSIIYGANETTVKEYNPPPQPILDKVIQSIFVRLPKWNMFEVFVRVARIYQQALEMIEELPEVAYELLVFGFEAMANSHFASWRPNQNEAKDSYEQEVTTLQQAKIPKSQIRQLVNIWSAKDNWSMKKIVKFAEEFCPSDFSKENDLFKDSGSFSDKHKNLANGLKKIYEARSGFVHRGKPLPTDAFLGLFRKNVPVQSLISVMHHDEKSLPPLPWFEKVFQSTISNYICKELRIKKRPVGSRETIQEG